MSTRRSPALKDRSADALPTTTSDVPSPSRNGSTKASSKRSCLENGRLCLLRSRGRSCWLGLFLAGVVLVSTHAALLQKLQRDRSMTTSTGTHQRLKMTYDDDATSARKDRILWQPLSGVQNWKVVTGRELFERAHYRPKPLMVGMLLLDSSPQSMVHHYNMNRRRSSQLKQLELNNIPPTKAHEEEFQFIKINHQNHQVHYLSDNNHHQKQDITWDFSNALVQELGNGVERQKEIKHNSKDYNRFKPDALDANCEPQYEWQTKQFPNCNELHGIDILTRIRTLNPAEEPESILLARGGYRDVWFVEQNDLPPDQNFETIAMKTLLYEHPWTERNMDRHRRDALATERLSKSPNALNLFGYCGNTGLYEFADGGSLEDAVDNEAQWKKWTSKTKMKYAYQVAQSIADTHNIDKEGKPSMSHTDISMSQFVSTDGGKIYRINDFNRARFLFQDKHDHDKLCKFEVSSNKGKFRSPEEYAYKPESAAIDTYSMGNIFFVLLTGDYPFPDNSKKEVKELVKKGQRPEIDSEYLHSDDPLVQALVEAMRKCWVQNPEKRATSREVEQFLRPFALGLEGDKSDSHR